MRRKKDEARTPGAGGRITPKDVQEVEFRLAFRGYNERDVDAFLDRVTEDLAAYLEELERLRAGAGAAPTAPDVQAARAEADRILAEARARAAALGAGGDARAYLAPFLNREREFLQSLGSLVQSHAEEIKAMVLALRARSETTGDASEGGGAASVPEPARAEPGPSGPTAEEAFAPIAVPEAGRESPEEAEAEPARAELRRDSGERSLRELFWGED